MLKLKAWFQMSLRVLPFHFFFKKFLFIYRCAGLSLAVESRPTHQVRCMGFSLRRLHLLQNMGSRACGLQQLQLPGSRAQPQ